MYETHIDVAKEKMQKTIAVVKKDLATMRAGRANPQILDRSLVDYYGTPRWATFLRRNRACWSSPCGKAR